MKQTHNNSSMKKITYLSKQHGASLLEGIAYLGIAAIVILGAVSLLTGAFSSAQTNRASEEVISIRTAVKKLYMGQSGGYPAGDLLPTLVPAKALPSSLSINTGANTVLNSWGGAVLIQGAGATFTVSYALVPQDVCINLLSGATGWDTITGGGAGIPSTAMPPTAPAAQGECTAATNTIVWTAR